MGITDIKSAGAAVNVSASTLPTQISTEVAAKSLDAVQEMGEGIKKMMEMSVQPNLGRNIDYSV